jgi:glycosyltransferase involved in cell wall biosynthesis
MKILHISSVKVDYPGGTEKVIWELARRQVKRNKVVILQTNLYQETESFKEEEIREGVKIITCKNNLVLGGFGYSGSFKKTLKRIYKDFDVIHIHGHGRFTSTFSLTFLKNKKPLIYSAQGFFHNPSIIKKAYDKIFGSLLKNASICTALTRLEEKNLKDHFRIKQQKIQILPGGINLAESKKPSEKELRLFKKKYHLDKKTLLYVGRIHESKGIQDVLEEIKDLDYKFLIVGKDSGYKKVLEQKIKELRMEDRVIFTGEISKRDLTKAYSSCDLFVLFSKWEGFGIVVIEAMNRGLPVLVSNNGALSYLVKDGNNGYVALNKEELKQKIQRGLKKDKKIIRNAKQFAKQFNWQEINKKCEGIYESAISKK